MLHSNSLGLGRRDAAELVSAERGQQRGVFEAAVVDVNPDGHHPVKHFDRRRHVGVAVLDRPWAKSGRVAAFGDRDGPVLMPGDAPVQ